MKHFNGPHTPSLGIICDLFCDDHERVFGRWQNILRQRLRPLQHQLSEQIIEPPLFDDIVEARRFCAGDEAVQQMRGAVVIDDVARNVALAPQQEPPQTGEAGLSIVYCNE